jgi:hypothetical protein
LLKRFRILLLAPFLAVAIVGYDKVYGTARQFVMGAGTTPQALHRWWLVVAAFSLLMFGITASLVVLFVRVARKHADEVLTTVCVENVFIIWLLFALATITSDPVTGKALAPAGLAGLGSWLQNLGFAWCLFLLYLIFKAVDRSHPEQ